MNFVSMILWLCFLELLSDAKNVKHFICAAWEKK